MKKFILGLSLVFAASFANAQFSKGSINVSGDVGFHSYNDKNIDSTSNGYHFSPSVSYFVTSNIAVGAKLSIGGGSQETKTGSTTTTNKMSETGFGVFGRYYFTPANKFSLFANLGVDYNTTKPNTSVDAKYNTLAIGLAPGLNYFVSDHFAIEASYGRLGYSSTKSNASNAKAATSAGLDLDFNTLSFGLNYKF